MNISIFLQGRLNSTRLPNKIIKSLGGKTFIEQVIDRLKNALSSTIQKIIIVTSHNSVQTINSIFNNDPDIFIFSGSEENVLERFYQANQYFKNDIIIRCTGDNPFVSIDHINSILQHHIKHNADLTHYIGLPLGTGVEIISSTALNAAYFDANKPYQLEHVTPYLYENRDKYNIQEPTVNEPYNRQDVRLTVDEDADYKVAEMIFDKLYYGKNDFPLSKILKFWDDYLLYDINSSVKQIYPVSPSVPV